MIYIIIPVHNRIDYTLSCIASIKNQQIKEKIKIVLIDDGSTDGTSKIIKKNFPDIEIILGDGSLYWGGAVNLGIQYVTKTANSKDWILLINNDTVLHNDCIYNLLDSAKKFQQDVIISAITLSFNNKKTIIKSGTKVKSWFLNITEHVFEKKNIDEISNHLLVNVDFLTGRCLLHSASIFKKIGNYDAKNFKHYGADDEFTSRAKKNGFNVLLCTKAIVYLRDNKANLRFNLSKSLFSIKSSLNILNKFWISKKIVPNYAKVSFFLIGVLKSLLLFFLQKKK